MLREEIASLIKNSVKEQIKIEDYSHIFYKVKIANNFTEGGVFNSDNNQPFFDYLMGYSDRQEFNRLYREAIETEERFNNIEIHFDKEMNADAIFTWDQAFYDVDVAGNKKQKSKKK